jgi:hypothetical protein
VESIRAGLVFQLKAAVGVSTIQALEEDLLERAVAAWQAEPTIEILGNLEARRLSIVSFVVRAPSGAYLHHNFVVALLNDLFGIQTRGGCSCAGPYGHRLLGIDLDRSHQFEAQIATCCEGIKPGWVRVNFNYFLDEEVFDYLVEAVRMVARDGWRLLGDYTFDPATGLWHHRRGPVEPPLRLSDVTYSADGTMTYPAHATRAPASALRGYLEIAAGILATAPPLEDLATAPRPDDPTPATPAGSGLGEDFDALRWFELPASCLAEESAVHRAARPEGG